MLHCLQRAGSLGVYFFTLNWHVFSVNRVRVVSFAFPFINIARGLVNTKELDSI